jgi:wyosine [tRNA(Phe)-imidazoG37] synthetase (radical SAM superfamily)
MLLSLQRGITYGPVRSRRLGHSLGINLLPSDTKVCTFNCLYCQYGWTDLAALGRLGSLALPSRQQVADALERALSSPSSQVPPPAYITFSGNGEPTVHPDFPAIVEDVTALRNRLAPAARTAILSNSTTVSDRAVRDALARLDVRIMKLDAGTESRFRAYNQPAPGYQLASIVEGLAGLGDVTLQVLFAGGPAGNASEEDVEAWISRVRAVSPASVQVYTLDRGYPSAKIEPVERAALEMICDRLREAGVRGEVY